MFLDLDQPNNFQYLPASQHVEPPSEHLIIENQLIRNQQHINEQDAPGQDVN